MYKYYLPTHTRIRGDPINDIIFSTFSFVFKIRTAFGYFVVVEPERELRERLV